MSLEITTAGPLDCLNWIKAAWNLFLKSWLHWLIAIVVLVVANIILRYIPILGGLIATAVNLMAGVAGIIAMQSLDSSGTINWQSVQERTLSRITPIAVLAGINIGIMLVMMVAVGGTIGGAAGGSGIIAGIGFLLSVAAIIASMLINYFSIPLIALTDVTAPEAVKLSFQACLKNAIALVVFSLIGLVLFFIASIPLGLGLLLLIPVMAMALYFATKQIFPQVSAA